MEWLNYLYSFFSIGVFGFLIFRLSPYFRALPLGHYFWLTLSLKILATLFMVAICQYHYQGDLIAYNQSFLVLTDFFLKDPVSYIKLILGFNEGINTAPFHFFNDERAWYFLRLFHWLYLLGGNSIWTSNIVFSLVFYVSVFVLINRLYREFALSPVILIGAFFFLPSYVFWTSGYWKETISLTCLYWAFIYVLDFKRQSRKQHIIRFPLVLLGLWICLLLKFYFLVPVLIFGVSYLVVQYVQKRVHLNVSVAFGFMLLLIVLMVVITSHLHYTLRLNYVSKAIWINYFVTLMNSPGKAFVLEPMGPTFVDLLRSSPYALYHGLLAPFPSLIRNLFQVITAAENVMLLTLGLISLKRVREIHTTNRLLVLSLIGFILFSATLLALSCPNPGTLIRYKVLFTPVLALLALHALPVEWLNRWERIISKWS